MIGRARDAWQKLYSRHGLQYGGSGDLGPLARLLKPDMLVLDAGCGDGKTSSVLARTCEVVGCDFSREALLTLRLQRMGDTYINLVESNLTTLPFEREKFDAVVCVHTISHMMERDRRKAASELARVAKKGAYVLLEGFGREDIRFGEGDRVEDATFLRGNGIVTHYFVEGEMPGLFPGFDLVSEMSVRRPVSFGAVAGRREVIRVLLKQHG